MITLSFRPIASGRHVRQALIGTFERAPKPLVFDSIRRCKPLIFATMTSNVRQIYKQTVWLAWTEAGRVRSNQLSALDFSELSGNQECRSTDVLSVYLFDAVPGETPGRAEVLSLLRSRASRIPALRWSVAKSPGGFNFPYWHDSAEFVIEDHLTDELELETWDQFLAFVGTVSESVRDLSECLWRIHIVRGIADAPNVKGEALAVVLEASHALGDGLAYNAIARELFSSSPLPEDVPRLEVPNRWVSAIVGLSGTPGRLARAFFALRQYRRLAPRSFDAVPVSFSGTRALGVVTLDVALVREAKSAWPGTTVTSIAQTIVAASLDEYFGDRAPRALWVMAAAPEGAPVRGRNRLGAYQIETARGEALAQRVVTVGQNNRRARSRWVEEYAASTKLLQAIPALVVRQRPLEQARLHAVVSSIDRGEATMTLSSARIVWTADFPYVSPGMPISHGVYSIGDVLTISVLSGTDAIDDIRDYVEILETNAASVLACLERGAGGVVAPVDSSIADQCAD